MKTVKMLLVALFLSSFAGFSAQAQISKTSVSPSSNSLKTKIENKKFESPSEITDPKMRAELGSLSKYSFKFDLSYLGPAVGTPLAKDQPNPERMVRVNATTLKGALSARYRIDSNSSLALAGGISALHPFHGMERMNINTPQLVYDMFHRVDKVQWRNAFGASVETVPTYLNAGIVGGLNYVTSLIYDIGLSGFATTMDWVVFYKLYSRDYVRTDGRVPRVTTILIPGIKYNFSDRLSMNTNFGFGFWNPRALRDETALWPQAVTQRVGLGYAFSKTVYVSPYLNMYPAKLAMDTTTLNVSTTFSLL